MFGLPEAIYTVMFLMFKLHFELKYELGRLKSDKTGFSVGWASLWCPKQEVERL